MDEASFGAVVSSHALSAICTTPISPFGSLRGIPIGPEVSLELGISDRFVDIIREGFDIAIRMGSLADSDLVSRKIGDIRFVLAASPDYISRNSVPADLEALGRHVFVRYAASGRPWPYILADGTRLPTSGRFVTDDTGSIREAVICGAGIAHLLHVTVAQDFARPNRPPRAHRPRPRVSSSHLTPRWTKPDSNSQSRASRRRLFGKWKRSQGDSREIAVSRGSPRSNPAFSSRASH
jgi:DNA-binding transcriptional LysR family regulator